MQRRRFIRNSGSLITALALFSNRTIAQLMADPAWKITMLDDDTGIFTEKGGTMLFKLTKEGYVVVDAQFPDTAPHLIEELKKKSDLPFMMLINTHHHGDHSSGNIAFKGLVKHVLAHENSKFNQERVAKEKKTEDTQLYPDQTFDKTWCEMLGRDQVCLHYFGAGHTNGDSLVHLTDAGVVHMGDLMFNRRHPYVDKSSGASISNWITVLDKANETFNKKTKFICGHAAPGYDVIVKHEDLKLFGAYLGRVLQFVEGEIKLGKTKEEIIKAKEIPGEMEWKGADGIDRPLSAAYEELTAVKN